MAMLNNQRITGEPKKGTYQPSWAKPGHCRLDAAACWGLSASAVQNMVSVIYCDKDKNNTKNRMGNHWWYFMYCEKNDDNQNNNEQ